MLLVLLLVLLALGEAAALPLLSCCCERYWSDHWTNPFECAEMGARCVDPSRCET